MAAPQFVPNRTRRADKAYVSPPRRRGSWTADRPGDQVAPHRESSTALGHQGPDQGFAYKLARAEMRKAQLADHEHADDVIVGVVGLANRRASLYARAPMIDDIRLAFEIYGLYQRPGPELAEWRRQAFAGLSHGPAHYLHALHLVNAVPEHVLRGTVVEASAARDDDWRAAVGA